VGEDITHFRDTDVFCDATYQYTIASFNIRGESPATECWEITLPECPAPRLMRLRVGPDYGRNFLTGELGEHADFYLAPDDSGRMVFLADQEGQLGLVDLGDVGETPLHRITLPDPTAYERNGVLAVPGHTYAALARNGRAVIVFTLNRIGDPSTLTYIIYPDYGDVIEAQPCQRLAGVTPGGPCVSGDGACDPSCTPPDPGLLGSPVPEDAPDEFESYYTAAATPGHSAALAKPICVVFVAAYTPTDEDCADQPCITGDDICNAPCGTSLVARHRAGIYTGVATPDRTRHLLDGDCGENPCVWRDGVCDPICVPAPTETDELPAPPYPCEDTDGDGEIDTCYPPGSDVPVSARPVGVLVVTIDEDCGGPCVRDDVCDPYCDPYYDPTTEVEEVYDPDCGSPCDPAEDPCNCTPTTGTSSGYTAAELEELCGGNECPVEATCYGMYPGSPCTTPDGVPGFCEGCECAPGSGGVCTVGDGVVNPGEACDSEEDCLEAYVCDPEKCGCLCAVTGSPCDLNPFGASCVTPEGVVGTCNEDCSCQPEVTDCVLGDGALGPGESCDADTDCPLGYVCDVDSCSCLCAGETATCFGQPEGASCYDPSGLIGICRGCQCVPPIQGACTIGDGLTNPGEQCDNDNDCPSGSVCSPVDCTCVCGAFSSVAGAPFGPMTVGPTTQPLCWSPYTTGYCYTPTGEPGFCENCECVPQTTGGGQCVVDDGVTNPGEECDVHDDCRVGMYCSAEDCTCRCGGDTTCTWPTSTGACTVPSTGASGTCRDCDCIPSQAGACVVGDGVTNPGEECDTDTVCGDVAYCGEGCVCYCGPGPCANIPLTSTGSCTTDDGRTGTCQRCECVVGGGGTGNCGDVCSTSENCSSGLSCFNGVCWDDCICENDCGQPEETPEPCHACRDDSGCWNFCGSQNASCNDSGCCVCP